ncbi:hypothetical protein PG995_005282 [Apiospora arundinis]
MLMKASWKDEGGDKSVTAPMSVVISAFTTVVDIETTWAPQLRRVEDDGDTLLMYVDLAKGRKALGGSALAKSFGHVGNNGFQGSLSFWWAEWIPFRQLALASVAPSRYSRRPPVSSIVLKPVLAFLDFEIPAQNLDQVVDIVKLALVLSRLGAANLVVKAAQRADSYLRMACSTLSDNMPGAAACSTANGDDLRFVVSPSRYITSSMLLAARCQNSNYTGEATFAQLASEITPHGPQGRCSWCSPSVATWKSNYLPCAVSIAVIQFHIDPP